MVPSTAAASRAAVKRHRTNGILLVALGLVAISEAVIVAAAQGGGGSATAELTIEDA